MVEEAVVFDVVAIYVVTFNQDRCTPQAAYVLLDVLKLTERFVRENAGARSSSNWPTRGLTEFKNLNALIHP